MYERPVERVSNTHHYVPKPYVPTYSHALPVVRRSYGHLPYVAPVTLSHAYVPPPPVHNPLVQNAI